MKYYLVSQTSINCDDGNHLYNDTDHFLLKVENEIQYFDFNDYHHDYYHDHQMTELTENQFNSLKDTFEIRKFLMK